MKMRKNRLQTKLLVEAEVLHKKTRRPMMMNKTILVMIILKTKMHHRVKRLRAKQVVNQVKKPRILIKKPEMKPVRILIEL
jgi:hypothetical protein